MNFVKREFFEQKITVVVNEAHRDWPTWYMFAHHRECCQEAVDKGLTVVASEYARCDTADVAAGSPVRTRRTAGSARYLPVAARPPAS